MRIQLDTQGNWAEITPVEGLTRYDRVAVNKKIVFEGDLTTGRPVFRASMDDEMAEAVIDHVVTDWSLQIPVPRNNPYRPASPDGKTPENPGSLNMLTLEQDDSLRKAIQPHLDAIQGKNAPVEGNEVPTPASAS